MAGVAAVLSMAACASMQRGSGVQGRLDEPFPLPKGATATLVGDRLTVTFERVESDSRCPLGVQCIRAGEAKVQLQLRLPGQAPEEVILATDGAQPRYATYGAYDLHLVSLEPRPRTDVPHPRYVVTLRVTKR